MNLKKALCWLMLVFILLSICGCDKQIDSNNSSESVTSETEISDKTINLLYCYSDSFNPYTASTSINRTLCKLIFEPLIKLDNNFEPIYCIAQSAISDGNKCTVSLKSITFSDGSAVTADDIIYSYRLAKASSTIYSSQLYEVTAVSASDNHTIVFTLTRNDPYFINLLDFPIIKSGSDTIVDADGVSQPPIGAGRFSVNSEHTGLIKNNYYFGENGQISSINLIDAPDSESVSHHVEVGATDIYYTDISDGNIVRMSAKKTDVNLNSFVYIGINSSYGALANREMRYAIASAINRSDICKSAYYNNALPATGFFSPVFKDAAAAQTLDKKSNLQITVENLDKIGYNSLNENGYRINSNGSRLSFTLLVNSENSSRVNAAQLIANQLKSAGIEIKIIEKSYNDYLASLNANDFQLYLGEINILSNMDISPLVLQGGSAAYGVVNQTASATATSIESTITTADIINSFYSGESSINDVAGFLLTEMPQIPICYRVGLLFYDNDIKSGVEASQSDIYLSIQNYKY